MLAGVDHSSYNMPLQAHLEGNWCAPMPMNQHEWETDHQFFQCVPFCGVEPWWSCPWTVSHVTCVTGVEGPTFTTLDFPMTVSGCEAHKTTTFDLEMPHYNTLNSTSCIGLGSSSVNPLGRDHDQAQMEPYQLQTEILRLAHKHCQNGPWATWTFPCMVRPLQIPTEPYQIFLGWVLYCICPYMVK